MKLEELKNRGEQLGIFPALVAQEYGGTNKAHWEKAVADAETALAQQQAALAAEAAAENREARWQQVAQSPGAVVIIPAAVTAAVLHATAHGIGRMFRR